MNHLTLLSMPSDHHLEETQARTTASVGNITLNCMLYMSKIAF